MPRSPYFTVVVLPPEGDDTELFEAVWDSSRVEMQPLMLTLGRDLRSLGYRVKVTREVQTEVTL